jgi:hypothetical protein
VRDCILGYLCFLLFERLEDLVECGVNGKMAAANALEWAMFKAIDKWFFGYLMSVLRRPRGGDGVRHLMVGVCDHFEPYRDGAAREDARRCVKEWTEAYPRAVEGFRDADGYPPRHTFFYPEEEYDEEILDRLAEFCGRGFGEVEIHLHHRHDTAEGLREKLVRFRDLLHQRHGLLGVERLQTSDLRPQTSDLRPQTIDHREENSVEQKPQRAPREEGISPQRHGDTESENSMLREFQARSTPPEIPATPSGGIPGARSTGSTNSPQAGSGQERGDVRHLNPLLSLFSSFKKRYGNYDHGMPAVALAKAGTPWAKCPYHWISRFLSSLCLRASVVKTSPLRSSCASVNNSREENSVEQKSQRAPREENCISARGGKENVSFANFATSVNNSSFSRVRYGFIHGNWALCNSRPDGDWCGVNEELGVLAGTGCYADFTFPSLPSKTQSRMVNAIYYAKDTPGKPRGADRGVRVGVGEQTTDYGLRTTGQEKDENVSHEAAKPPRNLNMDLQDIQDGERRDFTTKFTKDTKEEREGEEGDSPRRHGGIENKGRGECFGDFGPGAAAEAKIPETVSQEGVGARAENQATQHRGLLASLQKGFAIFTGTVFRGRENRKTLSSQCLRASVVKSSVLMLITGPVGLNWLRRKWGVLPRIESAEISGSNPPTADRVRLWVEQRIGVRGRPDWVFVKLHTHGCVPGNARVLLGDAMRTMHETLQKEFNDGKRWQLHYVTAREMYNLVKAVEAGKAGAPGPWRDWLVSRPGSVKTDRGNAERGI